MEMENKRTFTRQMYANDSEVGRMRLQSVKENLYEATTKAVQYSIEMYAKKDLSEWVRTDLLERLDKYPPSLKREQDELEQGHISKIDFTNGSDIILKEFLCKDALQRSRNALSSKIEQQKNKVQEIEDEILLLQKRKAELETEIEEEVNEDSRDIDDYFDEDEDGDYSNSDVLDEDNVEQSVDSLDEDDDEDDDYDEEDEEENEVQQSEFELFRIKIAACKSHEEIDNLIEEKTEDKKAIEATLTELKDLTRDGKNLLEKLWEEELANLPKMRVHRNDDYGHDVGDEDYISEIGTWEPDAAKLCVWSETILDYIKTIEKRYRYYALFDEYYAAKEGKDKFDSCKVYVQRQIKELYVNRSNIVLEFAGDLYDKEDDEFNFRKLIENMAISWDTGIRYLTVVTNEDLPELNVFFKECLSGTKKYVDYYLMDRNALRDACKKRDDKDSDYVYFRLLYHLNPAMEKIYWKGRAFTKREFARQILYKLIKVKDGYIFGGRLDGFEKYLDGIDIKKWCEYHMLSEIYFKGQDDVDGTKLARDMEDSLLEFCNYTGKGKYLKFRKAIKDSVQLYFYMGKDYVFSYTRKNGQTVHWRSLEDVCKYIENTKRFKSYVELSSFIDELYKSDYFKIWKNIMKKQIKESEGM